MLVVWIAIAACWSAVGMLTVALCRAAARGDAVLPVTVLPVT